MLAAVAVAAFEVPAGREGAVDQEDRGRVDPGQAADDQAADPRADDQVDPDQAARPRRDRADHRNDQAAVLLRGQALPLRDRERPQAEQALDGRRTPEGDPITRTGDTVLERMPAAITTATAPLTTSSVWEQYC